DHYRRSQTLLKKGGIRDKLKNGKPQICLPRESLALDDSRSFFYINQLIGRNVFEGVQGAAGPVYFNQIRLAGFAQAKVNTQIILGKIAATAAHLINLLHGFLQLWRAAYTFNPRADPAAI